MDKIKAFKNAEEFNRIFGLETHNNGVVSRKNAILLTFYKSKAVWDWCRSHDNWSLLSITSMGELFNTAIAILKREHNDKYWADDPEFKFKNFLVGRTWYSNEYCTDCREGICIEAASDFAQSIRYINRLRQNKIYNMKAGKFYKKLILATEFGKMLPQQVLVFLLEELVKEWKAFVMSKIPDCNLVIDDNFERIYDSNVCHGDFCSCMVDQARHDFYEEYVDAKAAYLEKSDGSIIARCIIFPKVYDEDGNVWRLAERQYSRDGNEIYKQLLVNKLIEGGHIDGYKRVGAGCGDASAFVDNEGNSLSEKDFYIHCSIEHDDTMSYQDSFKYYMPKEQRAYNHEPDDFNEDDSLSDTSRHFYGSLREWDSYHECYCKSVVRVFAGGDSYKCDVDNIEEFEVFNGRYYHADDIRVCSECDSSFLDPNYYDSLGEYSDLTHEDYCCDECRIRAEREYKIAHNWAYSDFEDDFVEDKDSLTQYLHLDGNQYVTQTVIKKNVNLYVKFKHLQVYNGILVDDTSKMQHDDAICNELQRMYIEELN